MKFNVSTIKINGMAMAFPPGSLVVEGEPEIVAPPEPIPPDPAPEPIPPEPIPSTQYETLLPPPSLTGIDIYVSSSTGSDDNIGSSAHPKKSLGAAMSHMRHGYPDRLLLRCGDTWTEGFGRWKKGGASSAPMVIGAYGNGPRPLLKTGASVGLEVSSGAGTPLQVNHLVVQGLEFIAHTRKPGDPNFSVNGSAGVRWVNAGEDIQFVDCKFSYYKLGMSIECPPAIGILKNVALRDCIYTDSYNTTGHSQGVYISNVSSGLKIIGCVFDRNGYGDLAGTEDDATLYNHNIYLQHDCGLDTVVEDNIISRASSHGIQMRAGGIFSSNLLVRNPIGYMGGYDTLVPNSVAMVEDNVFLNATDISPAYKRGWGMEFKKIQSGTVLHNVVAHSKATPNHSARSIQKENHINYQGNTIWNWPVGTQVPCLPPSTGPFVNSDVSIESYCGALGLAPDMESFYAAIRGRSYLSPNILFETPPLLAYFHAGFSPA